MEISHPDRGIAKRSSRLTTCDVAIHGINYDRRFEGFGLTLGGDRGTVSRRLLGDFGGLWIGSLGLVFVGEVFLQPLGWETHGGYRINGGGRGGEWKEKSEGRESVRADFDTLPDASYTQGTSSRDPAGTPT